MALKSTCLVCRSYWLPKWIRSSGQRSSFFGQSTSIFSLITHISPSALLSKTWGTQTSRLRRIGTFSKSRGISPTIGKKDVLTHVLFTCPVAQALFSSCCQFSNRPMPSARAGDRHSISLHQPFCDRLEHEAAPGSRWWPMVDEVRCEARNFAGQVQGLSRW